MAVVYNAKGTSVDSFQIGKAGPTITRSGSNLTVGGATLTAAQFIGPATQLTVDDTSDTTTFPVLVGAATGDQTTLTDGGLTYNATTAALSTTTFIGALTGTASGNVTASGSPLNNEIAVFSSGTDINSDSTLTWDGTNLSATQFGGILAANLLDKSAAETVSGAYTFSGGIIVNGDVTVDLGASGFSIQDTDINLGGFTISPNARIATFSGIPSGTTLTTASLVVNPATGGGTNRLLLGVGHGGTVKFSVDSEGDVVVVGALTATSYDGILAANLLDKTANETVSGAWTHTGTLGMLGGAPELRWQELPATVDEARWDMRAQNDSFIMRAVSDNFASADTVFTINRTGVTVDNFTFSVPILATSYNGILAANLLDKAANETVSGVYTFTQNPAISRTFPQLKIVDTGAAVDEGKWRINANTTTLRLQTLNDAESVGRTVFKVERTGDVVDSFDVETALTAVSYGGITEANLLDKTATETISGNWTHSGSLVTDDSTTTRAGFNIPTGVAPTTPAQGDMWVTATDIFARINGVSTSLISGSPPSTITIANEAADTTSFPAFFTAATGTLQPKTNAGLTFNAATADFNSTLIAGIANANLLDKTATETVTAAWNFNNAVFPGWLIQATDPGFVLEETDGVLDTKIWRTIVQAGNLSYQIRSDADALQKVWMRVDRTAGAVTNITLDGDAITLTGPVTATSYGGITEANLLDKAAAETITGAYTFNVGSNAQSSITIGESTTLRGDAQDAALKIFGENAGTIFGAQFSVFSSNCGISGIGANPATNIQISMNMQIFGTLTADSFGGITSTNLLDKTATETISGFYTFTNNSGIKLSNAFPFIDFNETDAAIDEKRWFFGATGNGNFIFQTVTDAGVGTSQIMNVARTGTIIDSITFGAPILATSYDGVLAANLLDKTAAETITNNWIIDVEGAGPHLHVKGGSVGSDMARFERDVGTTGTVAISASGGDPQIRFLTPVHNWAIGIDITFDKFVISEAATISATYSLGIKGTVVDIPGKLQVGTGTPSVVREFNVVSPEIVAATFDGTNIDGVILDLVGAVGATNSYGIRMRDVANSQFAFMGWNVPNARFQISTGRATAPWMSINSSGDLLATSYAGVLAANLVDKTAGETISGSWILSNMFIGDLSMALTTITTGNWHERGGYSAFVNSASVGKPAGSANHGYYHILGNRDISNGYGALWQEYTTGKLFSGFDLTGADATWTEMLDATHDQIKTAGSLTFNDNIPLRLGTGNDASMAFNATDMVTTLGVGVDWRLHLEGGAEAAIVAIASGAVTLYHNGSDVFRTASFSSTGQTSGAEVNDNGDVFHDVGFNDLRVFNRNLSDTLEAQHAGQLCIKDATTARTLTLAASTNLDFPVGGMTTVINAFTSGNYTITEGASTTLFFLDGTTRVDTTGGAVLGPGGVANIYRDSATVYYIWGTGVTP